MPSRMTGSGIDARSSSTPRSTSRSVAVRAKNPSGSSARSTRGTIVSQNARSVSRWASVSSAVMRLPRYLREPLAGGESATGRLAAGREEDRAMPEQQRLDPSHIMQVGMGFWASKTVLSAVELEVFPHLGDGSMTGEELGERVGLHARAIYDFLDALVALGILERDGDGADG